MDDREISLWLDRRWYAALEKQHGTSLEDILDSYLDDLINELPQHEYERISREIAQEFQRNQKEMEDAQRFSVFHVIENGEETYCQLDRGLEILDAARMLRAYLRQETGAAEFSQMLYNAEEISAEDFDQMASVRMENTGKVTGAFELDFDEGIFSAVHIMDGWKNYSMKDVSAAAYHAQRKGYITEEQRWRRFLEKLEGKELTATPEPEVMPEMNM